MGRIVTLVVACGLVLAPPAMAQKADDADALNALVVELYDEGKYAEAIPIAKRVLTIREKALGLEHPEVAAALNSLAKLYHSQGRYAEAESLYKRSLSIREKALGLEHRDVAATLNNLGSVYRYQGKYEDAIKAYSRALTIREKALGPTHSDVAATLLNLGNVYVNQGKYEDAIKAYSRALAIDEAAHGPDHPDVATDLNSFGIVYRHQGKYGEAIKAYSRVLAIREKALGPEHPLVAATLSNLGLVYWNQGKYEDALRAYDQALAIDEEALGPEHPDVAETLNNLGMLFVTRRDWGRAEDYWQRATAIIEHRISLGAAAALRGIVSKERSEAVRNSGYFQGLVKAAYRRAASDQAEHAHEAQAMFVKAQWAVASKAAAALAKMAARGAKGDTKLAALVRERQDLVVEWQRRDEARTAAVSQPPQKRNMQTEAANVARLLTIEAQVADIDKQLKKEFPDYAALVSPKPLSIGDVQSQLRSGEALVLFLDTPEWKPTPEETFIWAVTKTDSRWVRSDLGTPR